jgi:type VI secretion system protein ImpE
MRATDSPAEELSKLTEVIRANPSDFKNRVYLAQLLCIVGQWQRALNQLNVAAQLDPIAVAMEQVYAPAIRGEALRTRVFCGQISPMIFGQPDSWVAMLIESHLLGGRGQSKAGALLRAQAFDLAPTRRGHVDGSHFDWIADADARLGPVLEAFVNGRYYWIPFERLARVQIDPPADLRDYVWVPVNLTFVNGGQTLALLPARYPDSQLHQDPAVQWGKKTVWEAPDPEANAANWFGFGQRVLCTDVDEYALLSVRDIQFEQA